MNDFWGTIWDGIKQMFGYGKQYVEEHPEVVEKIKEKAEEIIK